MLLEKANKVIDDIMNKFETDNFDMLVKRCGNASFLSIKEKEAIIDPDFLRLVKIIAESRDENIKDLMTSNDEIMKINETINDIRENLLIISSINYDPHEPIFNIFEITNVILYILKFIGKNENMTTFDILKSIQENKYIEVEKIPILKKIKRFIKKKDRASLLYADPFSLTLISILADATVSEIVEEILNKYYR